MVLMRSVLILLVLGAACMSGARAFVGVTTPTTGTPRLVTTTATGHSIRRQQASQLSVSLSKNTLAQRRAAIDERDRIGKETIAFLLIPPILGLFLWGDIAHGVSFFFGSLGKFQSVDGNAFSSEILRPTIGGIVVPASSIVLGTLFATTVNVLWNRQLQIRSSINKEVGELRLLRRALFGCFGTAQHSKRRANALELTQAYVRTIMNETQVDSVPYLIDLQEKRGISVNEMDELADMLHGADGAAASRQSSVSAAESLLVSLNDHRGVRVATTLSDFPTIHWVLLLFLYSSILFSFFIDTDQDVLQYLNSSQLRILFSVLLGVGSGAYVLLKGLDDPFQGPFSIRLAALQLTYFDDLLESDILEAKAECSPSALIASERQIERPNYNTRNTLYFHLLTGPWASTVKIAGEIFTWTFRKMRMIWRRMQWKRAKNTGPKRLVSG